MSEAAPRGRARRWVFVALSLLVPLVVVCHLFAQSRVAVPEFRVDALERGLVREVIPGGGAETTGVQSGDVIRTVDGIPFVSYDVAPPGARPHVGGSAILLVERHGHTVALRVPFVSVARVALPELIAALGVSLAFWGAGTVVLWRRFYRLEARFFFLLAQAMAVGVLMPPLDFINWYPSSSLLISTSVVAIGVSAPLLFHYHISYPVVLGSKRRRRTLLAGFYGVVAVGGASYFAAAQEWLFDPVAVIRLDVLLFLLEIGASVVAAIYVYARRAAPEGRRRLRVMTAGTVLSLAASTTLYIVPAAVRGGSLAPEWVVRLFLLASLAGYAFATLRHGLFGIDRLLNRALVYALLSLGIFALCIGPLVAIERFAGSSLIGHAGVVAGLALLVGLCFNWTRGRLQRWVDQLFYGGWYDYPTVVETVSDALAGSLQRHELRTVLTQEVPRLMHLEEARLWIGDPGDALASEPQSSGARAIQRRFPLHFRGRIRGLWTVGPREDGDPFSALDKRILETLARQADIALSNVLLVEALQDQLEQIHASREILDRTQRRLLHLREEERAHLARELHDGPIQMLVGLKLELGLLADTDAAATDETRQALADARHQVQDLLSALRRICAQLRPPILDTLGLSAAIEALADDWSAEFNLPVEVELECDGALKSLDDEVAVNLYRIVQEGLSNVARHAEAGHVTICLAQEDQSLILSLKDDGRGFIVPDDFSELTQDDHFGLIGIGERVHLIDGSWAVASAPGQGTMLRVVWQDDPLASS
jgi:signal transduction histidine kinase